MVLYMKLSVLLVWDLLDQQDLKVMKAQLVLQGQRVILAILGQLVYRAIPVLQDLLVQQVNLVQLEQKDRQVLKVMKALLELENLVLLGRKALPVPKVKWGLPELVIPAQQVLRVLLEKPDQLVQQVKLEQRGQQDQKDRLVHKVTKDQPDLPVKQVQKAQQALRGQPDLKVMKVLPVQQVRLEHKDQPVK